MFGVVISRNTNLINIVFNFYKIDLRFKIYSESKWFGVRPYLYTSFLCDVANTRLWIERAVIIGLYACLLLYMLGKKISR